MALVESVKKGGRYTIKEQEERRIQVYHLHFEENRSAVKIAQLLGVNRNTINDDIAYWHSQLAHEFNAQNISAKMTKQIQRMEIQRDRLLEYLDTADFDEKLKIEKYISEIDKSLIQHFSKMILSGKTTLEATITSKEFDDNEIKKFVRDLIFPAGLKELYSENELKFHFIRETKCDTRHAENLLERMKLDGLVLCEGTGPIPNYLKTIPGDHSQTFNLEIFAGLRGYATNDELYQLMKNRLDLKDDIEKDKEKEQRFLQKHGTDKSQWSSKEFEMYELGQFE